MATKEIITIIKTCDVCGKQVKEFASTGEMRLQTCIIELSVRYYYGPDKSLEVCQECSDTIVDLIDKLGKKGESK